MKAYEVRFSGLKYGFHSFDFEIGKTFFDHFAEREALNQEITGGLLRLKLDLEKKETMLVLDFHLEGVVHIPCAVCMEDVELSIECNPRIIGRYSDEELWHEDEVIHISSSEHSIDISELVFQFICLEVPMRVAHPEDGCDEEMIEELNKRRITENDEQDPRWDALKKLK